MGIAKTWFKNKINKTRAMKNNKSFTDSESGLNDLKGFRKGTADFFS